MEYRKIGDNYYIRMDRGDEIISNLLEICEKESIPSAVFSGIGGCWKVFSCLFKESGTKCFKYLAKSCKFSAEKVAKSCKIVTNNIARSCNYAKKKSITTDRGMVSGGMPESPFAHWCQTGWQNHGST